MARYVFLKDYIFEIKGVGVSGGLKNENPTLTFEQLKLVNSDWSKQYSKFIFKKGVEFDAKRPKDDIPAGGSADLTHINYGVPFTFTPKSVGFPVLVHPAMKIPIEYVKEETGTITADIKAPLPQEYTATAGETPTTTKTTTTVFTTKNIVIGLAALAALFAILKWRKVI